VTRLKGVKERLPGNQAVFVDYPAETSVSFVCARVSLTHDSMDIDEMNVIVMMQMDAVAASSGGAVSS
jgi:hypothetical protein